MGGGAGGGGGAGRAGGLKLPKYVCIRLRATHSLRVTRSYMRMSLPSLIDKDVTLLIPAASFSTFPSTVSSVYAVVPLYTLDYINDQFRSVV